MLISSCLERFIFKARYLILSRHFICATPPPAINDSGYLIDALYAHEYISAIISGGAILLTHCSGAFTFVIAPRRIGAGRDMTMPIQAPRE